MKRPSFLNKHRKNNGYELNTSTSSSSYSNTPNEKEDKSKEEVVLSSIAVLCNESKSHTKKHNTNRSSSQDFPSNNDVVSSKDVIVSQSNCGEILPSTLYPSSSDFTDTNAVPSSIPVFTAISLDTKEQEGGGEVSPTNVTEFNVSFGSADFDYFVGNRFTDLSANDDDEREHEMEKTGEKKTGESSNKETNESINKEKTDNVRYTMVEDNKTSKGGKKAKKKGGNNNKSSVVEFSNTFNDDTFSISLASTANNSNDISSYTQQDSLPQVNIDSASQQYINEHIQILLDTILLPADVLLPKSVKKEVSHTILSAFKSTANDVTDNIELILTLPADYIVNALSTNDEMKKKVVDSKMNNVSSVSSFMNSVNAGYASVSKSGNVSSSILNESNISNETIKTSNLLYCGSGIQERDFLYNTCVDQ